MTRIPAVLGGVAAASVLFGIAEGQAAPRVYGCFRVTADEVNIRERAFSSSEVIGTARKGDILIKWKRFCAWRGFWCPVRKGGLTGWADKGYLETAECPDWVLKD